MANLDLTALTEPYDEAAARRSTDARAGRRVATSLGWALLGAAVVAVPGYVLWFVWEPLVVLAVAGYGWWLAAGRRAFGAVRAEELERRWRLRRLANDNGFAYDPDVPDPDMRGAVFGRGQARRFEHRVVVEAPRAVTLGQYVHHDNNMTRQWGIATTVLSVADLPHLLLVSRDGPRRHSDVPVPAGTPVEIAVDDPGGEAFVVHGPATGHDDVRVLLGRTLFRPEVLADLRERLVDVEVVGGELYVHTHEATSLDPDTWHWILRVVDTVARALEQPTGS